MANKLDNLKPYTKGSRDPKTMTEVGRMGGIASGEARRKKANMRRAMEQILDMPATGKVKDMLQRMGYGEDEQVNANAIAATIYAMALKGDTKALEMVVNYAFQVSDDERKTKESDARISAMEKNGVDISVNSGEDDGGVVIYLPAIEGEQSDGEDNKAAGGSTGEISRNSG